MNAQQLMQTQADCVELRDDLTAELAELTDELNVLNRRILAGGELDPENHREAAAVRLSVKAALTLVGLDLCRQQIQLAQESN